MKNNRFAAGFATFMLIAGAPYVLFIATLGQMIVSYEPGTPSGGSALGVMMIFVWAYGIALLSCVTGLIYFGYGALKHKVFPKIWHWLTIGYSIGLALSPVFCFISQ
ncbi:hypothetical protein OU994_01025 [Pseudoduganella sp. SL102]|uniref:hypothetical protein n=1 Tax=Pseudoduganella sp. SL102 TaxID=2995154 RepID=UPI00248B91FD|nr:hypothetical protein [Pseudoduganella sp. SL102]WBS02920.1 hypothetical protein OU994_01025 [Pseudoduganella sp. SL102]